MDKNTALSGSLPTILVNLKKMKKLRFEKTKECEPFTPSFRNWIGSVKTVKRNNNYCQINPADFECSIVKQIPQGECNALRDLYLSTAGQKWSNSKKWHTNKTPCGWEGVTCKSGRVIKLIRNSKKLEGKLPNSLNQLSSLRMLRLHRNKLSGGIPDTIGQLSNLEYLRLGHNNMGGLLPTTLKNLKSLVLLDFSSNKLFGGVLPMFRNLKNLKHHYLNNNRLSGSLSSQLGDTSKLQNLFLFNNNDLKGSMPLNFVKLKKPKKLYFQNTRICEPSNTQFQKWIKAMSKVKSSKRSC